MLEDNGLESKSKMETLMEIVKLMKQLQGESMSKKPQALSVEVEAGKLPIDPTGKDPIEAQSDGESPSEEAGDLSSGLDIDSPEADQEEVVPGSEDESEEMELPEAFKRLLAEKLKR